MIIMAYTISILFIMFAEQCYTMEKSPSKIIKAIDFPEGKFVTSFANGTFVLIEGNKVTLYNDLDVKVFSKTFKNQTIYSCSCLFDKSLLALFTLHTNKSEHITIFDATQRQCIADFKNIIKPTAFNPFDDTIVRIGMNDQLTILNYKDNLAPKKTIPIGTTIAFPAGLSFNQTEKKCVLITACKPNSCAIIILNTDKNKFNIHDSFNVAAPIIKLSFIGKYLLFLSGTHEGLQRYNTNKKQLIIKENIVINAIASVPKNNTLFATFSVPDSCIYFWNIKNIQSPITSINICQKDTQTKEEHLFYRKALAFSHTGQKIFLVINKKCLIMPIPFEILPNQEAYHLNTQQKCLSFLFSLKQLSNCFFLPQDIISLLINYLVSVYKY